LISNDYNWHLNQLASTISSLFLQVGQVL